MVSRHAQKRFSKAVLSNNLHDVHTALSLGADIHVPMESGWTAFNS